MIQILSSSLLRLHRIHAVVMAMAIATATGAAAYGQSSPREAQAKVLFRAGAEFMKQAQYRQAIDKFTASLKQFPKLATRMNIAICYERLGQLATAHRLYNDTAKQAQARNKSRWIERANAAARALEPRVPKLIVHIPIRHRVATLRVLRDGVPIPTRQLDDPIRLNPGRYHIQARADGYRAYEVTIDLDVGAQFTVMVPKLKRRPSDPRIRRRAGAAGMVVGAAAALASIGLGWSADAIRDRAFDSGQCARDSSLCSPMGQREMNTAHARARWATITGSVGMALVGLGVALYVTAPKHRERSSTAVTPLVDRDHLGVAVSGRFR